MDGIRLPATTYAQQTLPVFQYQSMSLTANGNYRKIGTTTSDINGAFSMQWKPDITGKYTVIATFAGSESYFASHAETSFAVDQAAPTTAPTAATSTING